MTLTEQVEKLSEKGIFDEDTSELIDALNEYHELIVSGELIPRGNQLSTNCCSLIYESNLKLKF